MTRIKLLPLEACPDIGTGVAAHLSKNGDGFYVNVHTAAFPTGAVRDQLGNG